MLYFILVLIIVALIASLTNKISDIDCLKEEKRELEDKAERFILSKNRLESENNSLNSLNDELIWFRNSVRSIWDFVKTKKSYEKHKGKWADLFLVVTSVITDLEKDLKKSDSLLNETIELRNQEQEQYKKTISEYKADIENLKKEIQESKKAVKTPAKKTTTKKLPEDQEKNNSSNEK